MIINCKVLTWDEEKSRIIGDDTATDTWVNMSLDLNKVAAIREAIADQKIIPEQSVIYLDYTCFITNIPFKELFDKWNKFHESKTVTITHKYEIE
jgi:hypothetical protein